MRGLMICGVSLLLAVSSCASGPIVAPAWGRLAAGVNNEVSGPLEYLLYVPRDWSLGADRTWPVILHLHGAADKDISAAKHRASALPTHAEKGALPFIVVSPVMPGGWGDWGENARELDAILNTVVGGLHGDPKRLYCTGYSMGGWGTFHLTALWTDRFAAAAPLCGFWDPSGRKTFDDTGAAAALLKTPLWVLHGELDSAVPVDASTAIVRALEKRGGKPRYTVFPDLNHDIWSTVYAESFLLPTPYDENAEESGDYTTERASLFAWFLEHRRGD